MTEFEKVLNVLIDADKPLALHEIQRAILERYGTMHAETGISARVREVRRHLTARAKGLGLYSQRVPGKHHYRYWIDAA